MVTNRRGRKKRKLQSSSICRVEYADGGHKSAAAMAMDREDRFSNMPEAIIHHIMSFLPTSTDTISLSRVSKTFSTAFRSLPIINLDFHNQQAKKPKRLFLNSIVNYLQSRAAIRLDKLRFVPGGLSHILSVSDRFSIIETIFRFAIEANVKELELEFQHGFLVPIPKSQSLNLPSQLCFSKTIRVLKLKGILHPRQLQNQDLIISSPSMENLSIIDCSFIGDITLGCNDKLKHVEIIHHKDIQVEGPTPRLEYFSCHCVLPAKFKSYITSSTCPRLKHMEFNNRKYMLPESRIDKQYNFSGFRSLETLKLVGCSGLKEIKLHDLEYLNALELDYVNFTKVDIEAPNLVSFIYKSFSQRTPEINISSRCTNLKHLEIQGDCVPRRWVAENFSEFLVLETLKLSGSGGLNVIKLHLEYLNALELVTAAFKKVEIEAPNLVSLIYESVSSSASPPEINISSSSTNLKHLQFKGKYVPQRWVVNNFSEFIVLETLELHAYGELEKVKFHLPCLKVLNLFLSGMGFIEAEIVAPNLVSFIYKTKADKLVAPSITFTSNAKPDVTLHVSSRLDQSHFPNMVDFMAYFAHRCNTFTLHCMKPADYRGLINSEKKRKKLVPPLYNFKHLKVELVELVRSTFDQLIDCLLWLAPHPNTLSIIVGSQVKSLELYYKNENVENWQHNLEEVVLKNFEGKEVTILKKYFHRLSKRK